MVTIARLRSLPVIYGFIFQYVLILYVQLIKEATSAADNPLPADIFQLTSLPPMETELLDRIATSTSKMKIFHEFAATRNKTSAVLQLFRSHVSLCSTFLLPSW